MGSRPFSATGLAFLAQLPPILRGSCDYQACLHALAREVDLLEVSVELVRSQFDPAAATVLLDAWEYALKLPVGGAGSSTAQRQQKVLTRLERALGSSEGRDWEQQITNVIGMGWTYEEHIPGDATSPPANTIHIVLPFSGTVGVYQEALIAIRELTPAHLALTFATTSGFRLDEGELDLDSMNY